MALLNLLELSAESLNYVGIAFRTRNETRGFLDALQENLEARIGQEISKGCTEQELKAFNSSSFPQLWLEERRPDYKSVVEQVCEDMELELLIYRSQIPGVVSLPSDIGDAEIENVGFSSALTEFLVAQGISVVRDIVSYGNYSRIPSITPSQIDEIRRKLKVFVYRALCAESDLDFVVHEDGTIEFFV